LLNFVSKWLLMSMRNVWRSLSRTVKSVKEIDFSLIPDNLDHLTTSTG
jgi:hypothetical protein